jgi:hypothetical protein
MEAVIATISASYFAMLGQRSECRGFVWEVRAKILLRN